jgi:hypothetical protein
MDHETRIQAAISDLESQTRKNYFSTTRKWNIERTTLTKRFRGETNPKRDTTSYAYK